MWKITLGWGDEGPNGEFSSKVAKESSTLGLSPGVPAGLLPPTSGETVWPKLYESNIAPPWPPLTWGGCKKKNRNWLKKNAKHHTVWKTCLKSHLLIEAAMISATNLLFRCVRSKMFNFHTKKCGTFFSWNRKMSKSDNFCVIEKL